MMTQAWVSDPGYDLSALKISGLDFFNFYLYCSPTKTIRCNSDKPSFNDERSYSWNGRNYFKKSVYPLWICVKSLDFELNLPDAYTFSLILYLFQPEG